MNTNQAPDNLLPWLTFVGFITKKLHAKSGNTNLSVLSQRWDSTHWWDRHVLNLDFGRVMYREIVTCAWDKPCWYARTILPLATYQANPQLFDRLQTQTLGDLIFNGADIKRVALRHYPINRHSIEYHWLTDSMGHVDTNVLWVRLSTLALINQIDKPEFYLVEILLPGLETYLC